MNANNQMKWTKTPCVPNDFSLTINKKLINAHKYYPKRMDLETILTKLQ